MIWRPGNSNDVYKDALRQHGAEKPRRSRLRRAWAWLLGLFKKDGDQIFSVRDE